MVIVRQSVNQSISQSVSRLVRHSVSPCLRSAHLFIFEERRKEGKKIAFFCSPLLRSAKKGPNCKEDERGNLVSKRLSGYHKKKTSERYFQQCRSLNSVLTRV